MVQLTHAHIVDTRPFLPHREGPGDKAKAYSYYSRAATIRDVASIWYYTSQICQ